MLIWYICDFIVFNLRIKSFLETEMYQENDEEFIRKISQTRDYILVTRKKKGDTNEQLVFGN
jgi:hypothetical protein